MGLFKVGRDEHGNRIIVGVETGERPAPKVSEFDESDLDAALAAEDANVPPSAGVGIPCPDCEFTAGSPAGLEAHRAAHHATKGEVEAALEEDVEEDDDADLANIEAALEADDEVEGDGGGEASTEAEPAATSDDDDLG